MARPGAGIATVLVGPILSTVTDSPWLMVVGVVATLLAVFALQAVFPQDSTDRLAWWKDRRVHGTRRWEAKEARRKAKEELRLKWLEQGRAEPPPLPAPRHSEPVERTEQ